MARDAQELADKVSQHPSQWFVSIASLLLKHDNLTTNCRQDSQAIEDAITRAETAEEQLLETRRAACTECPAQKQKIQELEARIPRREKSIMQRDHELEVLDDQIVSLNKELASAKTSKATRKDSP